MNVLDKSVVILFYFWNLASCISTNSSSTNKRTVDDDYYLNDYDYEIANFSEKSDSFLLPNPESIDSKYTVDVLPNVELPDDSLADTDLKDHDFIDNLMYVYYGSHNRNENSSRPVIIIVGSVLSCAAQLLTIFCVLLKKKLNGNRRGMKIYFLHMMLSLCVSNFLFMTGVYAVKSRFHCVFMALTLHYFHLLTAFWIFLYCFYIYMRFSNSAILKSNFYKYYCWYGYGLPVILTVFSFLVSPDSFETKRFCFISVHRGMLVNYMIPVFLLIISTTVSSLYGIQEISTELSKLEMNSSEESLNAIRNELFNGDRQDNGVDEEVISLRESRTCLRLLCGVQTGYDIVWFIVVLALDNDTENNTMALIYSVTSCCLNWYIFLKTKSFLPTIPGINSGMEDVILHRDNEKVDNLCSLSRRGSLDNIPLLINVDNGTEMKEFKLEYISTISS